MLCVLFIAFHNKSLAQQNPVIPLPANEAELFKYTAIPVGMFTGVPQISYPLYEINTGKIKVPIALSYHASGIKVSQKATWVGLGWSLIAGGSISRSINGNEDETNYTGWFNHYSTLDSIAKIRNYNTFFDWYNGAPDAQPDYFNFNINGKSARFLYSRQKKEFVTAPYQPVQIKRTDDNNYVITDDDGTRYFFGLQMKSYSDDNRLQTHVVGWNLTRIISNDAADTVYFNYLVNADAAEKSVDMVRTDSKVYSYNTNNSNENNWSADEVSRHISDSYHPLNQLQEIIFRQGKVTFYANTARIDYGGNALDSIVVYRKNNTSYERIKKVGFNYGYFYDGALKPSFYDYRLKLLSYFNEDLNGQQPERYQFGYDAQTLPGILSTGVDWWGFYNGHDGQQDLLPQIKPAQAELQNLGYLGYGNRDASESKIMAGILNKVIYPTGGFTTFKYGINKWRTIYDQSDSSILKLHLSAPGSWGNKTIDSVKGNFKIAPLHGGRNQLVTITMQLPANLTRPYEPPTVLLRDITTGNIVGLEKWESEDDGIARTKVATYNCDSARTYQICLIIAKPNTGQIDVNVTTSVEAYNTFAGGGIHIDDISTYDIDSTLKKRDVYTYGADESGMGYMPDDPETMINNNYTYTKTERKVVGDIFMCVNTPGERYVYSAQSSYPAVSLQGANVVYPFVTKYEFNNNKPNGKTIYQYDIENNYIFIPNAAGVARKERIDNSLSNELLTDVRTYKLTADSNYVLQKHVNNDYGILNLSEDSAVRIWPLIDYIDGQICDLTKAGSWDYYIYKIKSGARPLDRTIEENFDDNGTTFSSVVSYTFNSKGYPKAVTRSNSKNDTLVTTYRYPGEHAQSDVNAAVLNAMTYRNMIRQPYWTGNYTNGTLLGYNHTLYGDKLGDNDSLIAPLIDSNWLFGNDNSLPANTIAYQSYGKYGNLRQVRDDKGITTAYTWSPDQAYPLTQTVGAPVGQVLFDGFEYEGTWTGITRSNAVAHTGNYAGLLQSGAVINPAWLSVGFAQPTRFRYSGWIYSSGPGATINLLMKKNGETASYSYIDKVSTAVTGKWVYVEKEFDVPANVSAMSISLANSGNGNIWFDDIKLRPAASQMSNFTYQSLIGMSSKNDEGNHTQYYEFDGLNRLHLVRNKDRNILKMYCYNYAGEIDQCDGTAYYNNKQSKTFTRTCSSGRTSAVTYTVDAGTYSSRISVADANAKAVADINGKGQAYADLMGDCSYYLNDQVSDSFTVQCTNGTGSKVLYTIPFGTDTSWVNLSDANAKAKARLAAGGQAYANAHGYCIYYNEVQSGSFRKACSSDSARGTLYTYTVPANRYGSTTSLADANAKAKKEISDSGQVYANRTGTCYFYSDPQSLTKQKSCATGYIGSNETFRVGYAYDSSTTSKADANQKASLYVANNAQKYADSVGQCQVCNLFLSRKSGATLSGIFTVSIKNKLTGESLYSKTFSDPTDASFASCAYLAVAANNYVTVTIAALSGSVYPTVNGTEKAVTPAASQSWDVLPNVNIVFSNTAATVYKSVETTRNFQKTNCTGDSTGTGVNYTVPAGTYSSTISQNYVDSLALVYCNANGPAYANSLGYCLPKSKNLGIVEKKGATSPGQLAVTVTRLSDNVVVAKTTSANDWPYYTAITGTQFKVTVSAIGNPGGTIYVDVNGTQQSFNPGGSVTFSTATTPMLILVWKTN